jgi:hypothetical protein
MRYAFTRNVEFPQETRTFPKGNAERLLLKPALFGTITANSGGTVCIYALTGRHTAMRSGRGGKVACGENRHIDKNAAYDKGGHFGAGGGACRGSGGGRVLEPDSAGSRDCALHGG